MAGASASAPSDPLHPTSIATLQQFHDHFAALSLSAEHEQDSLCREHLAEISGLREKCDGLIQLLKDGETEVGDMLNALGYVEERSESLRGACEDLLEEQVSCKTGIAELTTRPICSRIPRNWLIGWASSRSSRRLNAC